MKILSFPSGHSATCTVRFANVALPRFVRNPERPVDPEKGIPWNERKTPKPSGTIQTTVDAPSVLVTITTTTPPSPDEVEEGQSYINRQICSPKDAFSFSLGKVKALGMLADEISFLMNGPRLPGKAHRNEQVRKDREYLIRTICPELFPNPRKEEIEKFLRVLRALWLRNPSKSFDILVDEIEHDHSTGGDFTTDQELLDAMVALMKQKRQS